MKPYLLHHLLLESALKHPDKDAVRYEDQTISYERLEQKSSRLATLLIEAGLKPGEPVGVYLSKSIEAIISFFAVLKAGGVYLPLDATYSPLDRIVRIIKQSETRLLISNASLWLSMTSRLSSGEGGFSALTVVLTDSLLGEQKEAEAAMPALLESPGNIVFYDDSIEDRPLSSLDLTDMDLAYVLYTSGSTGVPKGVMISHLNALTFVKWSLSYFAPDSGAIFANHAPLNFDLSVFDIYVAIASGGTVALVPFQKAQNPRAMVEWMAENRISHWYSVPQAWITMLNYAEIDKEKLFALKHILFAGEIFPAPYLKKLMALLPSASYYNLYGPTETKVCTCHPVKSREEVLDRPVPIGRACANTQIIVLNDRDTPVLIGEEGELFVRGSSVTRGYYKDPERTTSAFKKSPFPHHDGALLYQTGDIVRKCKGEIYEYVGRKDLMVKCAGFRIELTEIEQALFQCEGVEEAVVVSRFDDALGTDRLSAFVTGKEGTALSIVKLKKHLAELLPRYMVPDTIKQVPEIPRNANGKADRQTVKSWA